MTKFYDDIGSTIWAFGHEFGMTQLISADSFESAWEIAIDESPTIEESETIEAYGFYLMQACHWNDCDSKAPWYVISDHDDHGELTSENTLVCTGDRRTIGGAHATKQGAFDYAAQYIGKHEFDLIEGYEYQTNSSGTGIVNVGHYAWLHEATPDELFATQ